jgi:CAAX protease family protein
MLRMLGEELRAFWGVLKRLDRQTLTVFMVGATLMIVQAKYGSRRFFRQELRDLLPDDPTRLVELGWHHGTQAISGFLIPVIILLLIFRRRAGESGLGLGDWKLAGLITVIYTPCAFFVCWFLSAQQGFLDKYTTLPTAEESWTVFWAAELSILCYWLGYEYLWRGFFLFGTKHTLGIWALFVQMLPFAALHVRKPPTEALLSIVGGVILAAIVWRCRSFWVCIPLHHGQMFAMNLFCALRERTGVRGVGWGEFVEALKGFGS